jgi:hypothetical protein
MDFTKFSDQNFDLKHWINNVFISQKDSNQNAEVILSINIFVLNFYLNQNKAIRSHFSYEITGFYSRNK